MNRLVRLALVLLLLLSSRQGRAEESVRIEPAEVWTNVLAGREVVQHFAIRASAAFEGRAQWSVMLERAPLVRREGDVQAGPERPGKVVVRFPAPLVREGVVLRATLVVQVADAAGKVRARFKRALWIFGPDPFAGRGEWLKKQHITLHDPANSTAGVLSRAGIPFTEESHAAALAEIRKGLVVIGAGASFKEEPGLADILTRRAAEGLPVLCLAPREGTLVLPGMARRGRGAPSGLTLRRRTIISALDRRLDSAGWAADGKVVASSLMLGSEEDAVTAEVVAGEAGWPWLELEYGDRPRLIVCGLDLVEHWSDSPTPRYLFAALLERLAEPEVDSAGHP